MVTTTLKKARLEEHRNLWQRRGAERAWLKEKRLASGKKGQEVAALNDGC